jgi:hypothetical protein
MQIRAEMQAGTIESCCTEHGNEGFISVLRRMHLALKRAVLPPHEMGVKA